MTRQLRQRQFLVEAGSRTFVQTEEPRRQAHKVDDDETGIVVATQRSLLAGSGPDGVEDRVREAVILAILITHPGLVTQFESAIEAVCGVGPRPNAFVRRHSLARLSPA